MKSLFKIRNAQQVEQLSEEQQTQRMFDRQIVQSTASLQNRDSTRRSGWQKFWGKNTPKPIEDIPKTNSRAVRNMLKTRNALEEEDNWLLRLAKDNADPDIHEDPDMHQMMETLFLKATENPMGAASEMLPYLIVVEGDLSMRRMELGDAEQDVEKQKEQQRLDKFISMVEGYIDYFKQPKTFTFTNGKLEKRDKGSDDIPVYKLDATEFDLGNGKGIKDTVNVVRKDYTGEPLFEHEPRIEDIKQGRMGDCYFLAALASAVRTNPNQIMENMRDNKDGTVTVRFFRKRMRAEAERDKESPYFQPLEQKGKKDYASLSPEEKLILAFREFQTDSVNHPLIGDAIYKLHPQWASFTHPQDVSLYKKYLKNTGSDKQVDDNVNQVEMTVIQCLLAENQDICNILNQPHEDLQATMNAIDLALRNFIAGNLNNGSMWNKEEYCRDNGNDIVYQEVDVTIKKELEEEKIEGGSTRPLYASGPLWVRLMERAYAASGLNADRNGPTLDGNKDLLKLDRGYKVAEGGYIRNAISHLTGKKPESTTVFLEDNVKLVRALMKHFNAYTDAKLVAALVNKYQLTNETATDLLNLIKDDEQKKDIRYKDKDGKEDTYRVAASGLDDIIRIIVKSKLKLTGGDADDIQNLKERRALAKKIVDDLAADENNKLQYARFTGQYTKSAENLYKQIQELIHDGKNVGATTQQFIPDSVNSSGLNGEAMDGGVVQCHAYTVLGVKKRGENRFIVLRNPWANSETIYHQQEDGSVTVDIERHYQGVFLVELNDFMRKFNELDYAS